jgi:hypothetical protein
MAGSGRKVFTAGDVLTASDVQNYLQDQAVMNFAGTADRSSAIATPTEGMVSYRSDIKNLELYNGSIWRGLGIRQIVFASTNTQTSNSTTTPADTTLTATITPQSTNSKILVIVNHADCTKSPAHQSNAISMRLMRGATQLIQFATSLGYTNTTIENRVGTGTTWLDSPSTTSATTYKTQFSNNLNSAAVTVQAGNAVSTIALIELDL